MLLLALNVMQPLHYSSSGATFQRTLRSLSAAAKVRAALGVCCLVQSHLKTLKNKNPQPCLCSMSSLPQCFFTLRLGEVQPTAQILHARRGRVAPLRLIRGKQRLLALQGVNSSAPRGFLSRHQLQAHLVFSGQTSHSWRKAARIELPAHEPTLRSPASSNRQHPGARPTGRKMIFPDESKALFPPGLPQSSGVISDLSPCCWTHSKAGGEGRWNPQERGGGPKILNWVCSLGSPGRGWMKAGLARWVWVRLHWIHALIWGSD